MMFYKSPTYSVSRFLGVLMACLFWITSTSFGQQTQTETYNPKVVPPAPNAAALTKALDIPVSYYTGAANISIPFYTIQSGDISVPITLSYNSSGIRLSEQASWVGLGWSLSSGGVISRTVMDKDDFQGYYLTNSVPEIQNKPIVTDSTGNLFTNPYLYDFYCNYYVATQGVSLNFKDALLSNQIFDFEADVFSYSFPGFSGKFIIKRDGTPLIQSQDNLKISYTVGGTSFTIIDDRGFKYVFSGLEYTSNSSQSGSFISSWYLTQITSPTGRQVNYVYATDGTPSTTQSSTIQTRREGCPISTGLQASGTPQSQVAYLTLTRINFDNGAVVFNFDVGRTDLSNSKRLNKCSVYRFNSTSDSTELYSYNLYYSYFNPGYTGASAFEYQRLKLDSVRQSSGTSFLPPYKFAYHDDSQEPSSQTGKSAFNIDHWGYYNGTSNSQLPPAMYALYAPTFPVGAGLEGQWLNLPGGDRNPQASHAQLFSLNAVTYPTGGKTVFEFENNDYDENNSFSFSQGPNDIEELNYRDSIATYIISTRGTTTNPLGLNYKYGGNVWVNMSFRCGSSAIATSLHNTSGLASVNILGNTVTIEGNQVSNPSGTPFWTTNEVSYNVAGAPASSWSIYISPTISSSDLLDITLTIKYKVRTRDFNGAITAGGLRVKSITNYNESGIPVGKRKFLYGYLADKRGADGLLEYYSYGRLVSRPSYTRYETLKDLGNTQGFTVCQSQTRTGSTIYSITSSSNGTAIGYDKVIEVDVDPANEQTSNGRTEYTFYNIPDTVTNYNYMRLPGMSNFYTNLNGKPKGITVYRDSAGVLLKVSEQMSYYSATNRKVIYNLKYDNIEDGSVKSSAQCGGKLPVMTRFYGFVFPAMQSEKVLLDSTTMVDYGSASGGQSQMVTTKYTYSPIATYKQLWKTETTDSKGVMRSSESYYPYDYTGPVYDSMVARNMLTSVVAQKSFVANNLTSHVFTAFKFWQGTSLILPDTILTAVSTNGLEQVVRFNNYDSRGNVLEYYPRSGQLTSFLWDFNQSYPIAKAVNASSSAIAYTSFETNNTGNWTIADQTRNLEGFTGTQSFVLNSTNSIVFSNTSSNVDLIVSYWSKSGVATITGATIGSTKTGASRNGWTYNEHRIKTSGGNITLASGSAVIVDELRLYPASAQMETYTYLPLLGTTSKSDVTNSVGYYIYDEFGRLKMIKDADGNVLKTMEYNYRK